jgi:hypothetical protein
MNAHYWQEIKKKVGFVQKHHVIKFLYCHGGKAPHILDAIIA